MFVVRRAFYSRTQLQLHKFIKYVSACKTFIIFLMRLSAHSHLLWAYITNKRKCARANQILSKEIDGEVWEYPIACYRSNYKQLNLRSTIPHSIYTYVYIYICIYIPYIWQRLSLCAPAKPLGSQNNFLVDENK